MSHYEQLVVQCLQCFDTVGWASGRATGLQKIECWGAGMVIRLEWGADCLRMVSLMPLHPQTPSSPASFKSSLVLLFWYRFNQVVLEKRQLNGCSSSCPGRAVKLMCVQSVTLNYVTFDLGIWHFGIKVYLDTVSVKFEAWYCLLQFTIIGGTHTHPFNDPFSWTARLSQYQKGKNQSGFYWSKRRWVAVASAGPYASLHLAADR